MTDEPSTIGKEQKLVNRVYAAAVVMVVFSCVPSVAAQLVAFVLLVYVMASAYGLRRRWAKESMVWNHMEYLIRTFWISSLLFLIGFAAAGWYLYGQFDMASVGALSESMMQGQMPLASPQIRMLAVTSLVTLGPSLVYFVYRVVRGLSRAVKGYRMNDVKAWF